jgi:hypothetical protein
MNPVQIGRKRLSEIVWDIIGYEGVNEEAQICGVVDQQQPLREKADYKTGSLPLEDAIDLYLITKYFQPKVIAEVGTFIGVSTMVMDLATSNTAQIRTCDVSNRIDLAHFGNIEQYFHTPSYEMFADMAKEELKADLVYLDGRLSQQDVEPLNKIIHDKTVFVLDDFEGVEKGVANAMMVESFSRALIYPREGRKTAVSIPFSLLQIVPQEAT